MQKAQMNQWVGVQPVHYGPQNLSISNSILLFLRYDVAVIQSGEGKETIYGILVPKLTFCGTRAPHCTTSHADCNSNSQNTAMRRSAMRVKSGSRKLEVRILAGLMCGRVGAIGRMR